MSQQIATCKTCKFWNRIHEGYVGDDGSCECPKIKEDDYSPKEPDMLVYSYLEDGSFWTGPEFGCVHHDPVEGAK